MEDIDYKHFTFELISAIKARVDFKEGDQVGLTKEECNGMQLGYSYIMDDLLFLMKEFHLQLEDYGFE